MLPAAERLPILNELGIRTVINGPIPISPDGEPIMGLAPERDNFYVACGFTSGIAASGGAGKAMARMDRRGRARARPLGLRRAPLRQPSHERHATSPSAASTATGATTRSTIRSRSCRAARGGRRSPLYPLLAAKNAVFGSRFGWERPNWFAPAGTRGDRQALLRGPAQLVRPGRRANASAARERAVLIDQSSFSKYEIAGPGAFAALQRLAANDLDKPAGRAGLHPALQRARRHRGRPHLRPARREPLLHGHRQRPSACATWAGSAKHLPADGSVTLQDLTSARATINLAGPLSRRILEKVADGDVSNAAFPYMTRARAAHRLRAGAGAARHLSRRARLGAAPADRVRRPCLRAAVGGRPGVRHRRCRLPRHRFAAAGEALSLLGLRHHARLHALRGGPRLRGVAQEEGRLHRPRRAGEGQGRGPAAQADHACWSTRPVQLYGGEAIRRDGKVLGVTSSRPAGATRSARPSPSAMCRPRKPATPTTRSRPSPSATPRRRIAGAAVDPERKKILA